MFGLSGFVSHPKSARCSFVMSGGRAGHEAAVRISSVEKVDVHHHILKPGFKGHWRSDRLQLNHHRIQSKEYFGKYKMTRGDAQSGPTSKRTWDYFNDIDKKHSDHADAEICSILGCCAS